MTSHTIGEVLNRLKGEFDDITISKIRFLEAEGLISPDRTDSGYRKFTAADIDRLRYVLRAQRDRYLPLRVIKDELDQLDAGRPPDTAVAAAAPTAEQPRDRALGRVGPLPTAPHDEVGAAVTPATEAEQLRLSATALAEAAGLRDTDLDALRDHGILGPGPAYDADDQRIATLAAGLLARGLEARHLRMYRQFADREAALAEQLVAPLLRQRNPDSRTAATEQAEHLAAAGGELRHLLLVRHLRALLRS